MNENNNNGQNKRKRLHIHPSPFQLVVHLSRLLDNMMNHSWCSLGALHGALHGTLPSGGHSKNRGKWTGKKKKITWSAFTFKGRIRSRILTLGLDFKIWILKNISTIILSGYVMTRISILPTWPVQPLITHLCNAEHDQLCDQFSRMTCQLISTLMLHHRIELGFLAAKTISVK